MSEKMRNYLKEEVQNVTIDEFYDFMRNNLTLKNCQRLDDEVIVTFKTGGSLNKEYSAHFQFGENIIRAWSVLPNLGEELPDNEANILCSHWNFKNPGPRVYRLGKSFVVDMPFLTGAPVPRRSLFLDFVLRMMYGARKFYEILDKIVLLRKLYPLDDPNSLLYRDY